MSGFPILLVCLVASAVWPSRSAVNAAWHQTDEYNSFEDNYYPYPNGNERVYVYKPTYYEYEPKYGNYPEEYNSDPQTSHYEEDNTWQTSKSPVIPEGNRWIIKLALFALPSLFDDANPEELREELEANLKGLDEWTDILSGQDFSVEFDKTLHILDNKISLETYGNDVYEEDLDAVMKYPEIAEVDANIKVFLLPLRLTITSYKNPSKSLNGYARAMFGPDILDIEQHAFAKIFTVKEEEKDEEKNKGKKWIDPNPIDRTDLKNRVGIVMHEIGHLLGAGECTLKSQTDEEQKDENVMCMGAGNHFGPGREEIRCRLFQIESCQRTWG